MVTPAQGMACRPPVGRAWSDNVAVIAERKQTFAVRHGVKFRGLFVLFGCQTLFARHTFLALRPPCESMARFWAMTGRLREEVAYDVALSSRPVKGSWK